MIGIDRKKGNELYNEIKEVILAKENEANYRYVKNQHHMYEPELSTEARANFFNENGSVEFENSNGDLVTICINRWHAHQHRGWSGLNCTPCLSAKISIRKPDEENIIWELNVISRTLYYKAETTDLDIPFDILKEKAVEVPIEPAVEDNVELFHHSNVQEIVPKEARNIFETLNELQTRYSNCEQMNQDILSERKAIIKKEKDRIKSKYAKKIKKNKIMLEEAKDDLNRFDDLINKYSTFNIETIGKLIQNLVTLVEGEFFCYQEATNINTVITYAPYGESIETDFENIINIIINANNKKNIYYSKEEFESEIFELIKNGKAILLSNQNQFSLNQKEITFYNSQDGKINSSVNFGRFGYVRNFIDAIIQYRFKNKIDQIEERDLLLLLSFFIKNNKDLMIDNYQKRVDQSLLTLKPNTDN